MSVNLPQSQASILHPDAAKIIEATLARQDQAARRAATQGEINGLDVPEDSLDNLLRVWIQARRRDEGATRPMKRADMDAQVGLARKNGPLMTVIWAAYRMALADCLDDEEDRHDDHLPPT